MADPRLAARRRAAKFTSESDDLVIGRNAVLEALRCGVPATTLYVAARIEHDDRTREIVRLAGIHGLHLLEADRLEMDYRTLVEPSGRGAEGATVPVFLAGRARGPRR